MSKTSVPLLVPECSYLVLASFGLGKIRINLSPLRSIYDYNFFVKNTVIRLPTEMGEGNTWLVALTLPFQEIREFTFGY